MKFKKLLLVGITEEKLGSDSWGKVHASADKVVVVPKDSPDIMRELTEANGLLVNFGVEVTKTMIDVAPELKYIGVLATAYGKIDIAYAKEKGILVSNLAGYSTESVAEFTIAAILEHIRGLEVGKQRGRAGNYSEDGITAREIRDSIFGVIGFGSIGKRVGELAHGFGANVQYWSRSKKDTVFPYRNVNDLIKEADFVSINLAQTKDTEKFFNAEKIRNTKKGSVIVNTAPMELIDIDALATRLKQQDLTFILDHSDEMAAEDLAKLSLYQNCIIYPPMAYITEEARKAKKEMFMENIQGFLEGTPINVVNR
jgi:lactate dehydrogenase-like 2-hydroxyacid dehydrogenase